MTGVVPLGRDDFDEVYAAFLQADDPVAGREAWRRLFEWGDDGEPVGWALRQGGRMVGFLGAVIRRRPAGSGEVPFCNVHSWIVDPAHRGHSLSLLRPLLARKELVVTDFSPTAAVEQIDLRLGFRRLDARLRILLPGPAGSGDVEMEEDPAAVAARLDPADARALADHLGDRFGHAWAQDREGGCWVVYSVVERHPLRHVLVHRVSDPAAFGRLGSPLRRRLAERHGARFLAVPERLLGGVRVPGSVLLPVATRHCVRASGEPPVPIDTLYSEVAALGLTSLPDVSGRLREWLRR